MRKELFQMMTVVIYSSKRIDKDVSLQISKTWNRTHGRCQISLDVHRFIKLTSSDYKILRSNAWEN
jgi:hypothetical protein